MATGIAQDSCIDAYVSEVVVATETWAKCNEHQRAGRLIISAGAQLNKFSVPEPIFGWEEMTAANGVFDYTIWKVKATPKKWKLGVPKEEAKIINFKKGVAKLADTIYHEFRHCEQWFRMARFLALEDSAETISTKMRIEINIARIAKNLPALTGEELREGEAWYEGVYGRPVAPKFGVASATAVGSFNQRDMVLGAAKLKPVVRGQVVGKSEKANVQSDELEAISHNRQTSQYLQYRTLLEEEDAHAVGRVVQTRFYLKVGLTGEPEIPEHVGVRLSRGSNVTTI
jgi:hypothetical protein